MSHPNADRDERVDVPERICISPYSARVCNHYPRPNAGDVEYVRTDIANDSATRMRDRCVGKVREIRDGWQQKLDQAEEYSAVETVMSSRTYASDQIITALQSLTLEGEQETMNEKDKQTAQGIAYKIP